MLARWWARRDTPTPMPPADISPTQRAAFTNSWPWLLTLFTVAGFFESVFWGQWLAFTPLYLPLVGVAAGDVRLWVGRVALFGGLVGIPFVPFWGALADRYGHKPLIVRSYAALLIGAGLMWFATSPWWVVLGRGTMCFALGSTGLMMASLAERTPTRRLGLAFAIMNSSAPIGSFLGPILGGPVIDVWGIRTLWLLNVAMLVACIAGLIWGYQGKRPTPVTDSLWRMAGESLRYIRQSPRLRTLFPALFLLFTGWMLATTYIPLIVPTYYHGDRLGFTVGLVVGAGGLLTILIAPLLGALGDRYGCWRVLIGGATLSVMLWPLPAFMPTLWSFGVAWAILNGLTSGVFALSFTVLADAITLAMRGRIMCFAYLPLLVAQILGPVLGAQITQQSLFAIFPVAAVLTALGVAAVGWAAVQNQE